MRYLVYRQSRGGVVIDEVLGEEFDGVLVSDFYGTYTRGGTSPDESGLDASVACHPLTEGTAPARYGGGGMGARGA